MGKILGAASPLLSPSAIEEELMQVEISKGKDDYVFCLLCDEDYLA